MTIPHISSRLFSSGRCHFGDRCRFLHSAGAAVSAAASVPESLCKYFAAGSCRYGATCRSSHDSAKILMQQRDWLKRKDITRKITTMDQPFDFYVCDARFFFVLTSHERSLLIWRAKTRSSSSLRSYLRVNLSGSMFFPFFVHSSNFPFAARFQGFTDLSDRAIFLKTLHRLMLLIPQATPFRSPLPSVTSRNGFLNIAGEDTL